MHRGRTMGKHKLAFVTFDSAKEKHAVAIADDGRDGEVRYLGEIDNSPWTGEKEGNGHHRPGSCSDSVMAATPADGLFGSNNTGRCANVFAKAAPCGSAPQAAGVPRCSAS